MGMCIQRIGFVPIILAPKIPRQVSLCYKSDKCELREVSQYAVIAEDLKRLLSAAFSIRIIERGKITKGKGEGKKIMEELSISTSSMSTSLSLPT